MLSVTSVELKSMSKKRREIIRVTHNDFATDLATQLASNSYLREVNVNTGNCSSCPVRHVCAHYDEETSDCGAITGSVTQFLQDMQRSPWVKPEDSYSVRSLASLHAIIILCELFFKKYGAIEGKEKSIVGFNQLMKDYLAVLAQYNKGLAEFGMNPRGRAALAQSMAETGAAMTLLERYVKSKNPKTLPAKYSVAKHGKSERSD